MSRFLNLLDGGKRKLPLFLFGLVALASLFDLTRSPTSRYPDNQDFWRVMGPAGISYFNSSRVYRLTRPSVTELMSSASVVTGLATLPARVMGQTAAWDIRWQALFYWLAFMAVLIWAWHSGFPPWVVVMVSVVVFDPVWILYAASFRSETPMLFTAVACLFLLAGPKLPRVGLLTLVAIGALAKAQYAVFPLGVALVILLASQREQGTSRRPVLLALGAIFTLAYGLLVYPVLPAARGIVNLNRFTRVFHGVALATQNPEAHFADWKLDRKYWANRGHTFLNPVVTDGRLTVQLAGISYGQLAAAYLTELPALKFALRVCHRALAVYRPPAGVFSWFSASAWLAALAFSVAVYPLLFLLPLLGGILLLRNQSPHPMGVGLFFLGLTALIQIPVAVLGDGFMGLPRHLALTQYCLQLSGAWALGWWLTSAKIS